MQGPCLWNTSQVTQSSLCYSLLPLLTFASSYTQQSKGKSLNASIYTHKVKKQIFQHCNIYIRISEHWYGCLYILHSHMPTQVTERLICMLLKTSWIQRELKQEAGS